MAYTQFGEAVGLLDYYVIGDGDRGGGGGYRIDVIKNYQYMCTRVACQILKFLNSIEVEKWPALVQIRQLLLIINIFARWTHHQLVGPMRSEVKDMAKESLLVGVAFDAGDTGARWWHQKSRETGHYERMIKLDVMANCRHAKMMDPGAGNKQNCIQLSLGTN